MQSLIPRSRWPHVPDGAGLLTWVYRALVDARNAPENKLLHERRRHEARVRDQRVRPASSPNYQLGEPPRVQRANASMEFMARGTFARLHVGPV